MVSLVKGQKIDITKGNTGLKKITIGLGWDTNKYDGDNFDLDSSAFLLGSNGKVTDNKDFVFFNNLVHPSGSVKHMGDNLTGAGDGDDEQIIVNLPEVPSNIEKIAFAVTIYEADSRMQNFGMVENSFIRVVDDNTGSEITRYDLKEKFGDSTAIIAGEIYRDGSGWKFHAVGEGFNGGLFDLCEKFGIEVK